MGKITDRCISSKEVKIYMEKLTDRCLSSKASLHAKTSHHKIKRID
jgi:hypothetical protein